LSRSAAAVCAGIALICTANAQERENSVRAEPDSASSACQSHAFKKLQLTKEFWSEGVAFADINRDGHNDVVSGPYWYEGPDFKRRHEFRPALKAKFLNVTIDPKDGRLPDHAQWSDSFHVFVYDFNGDGWPDILSIGLEGTEAVWYENPGNKGLVSGIRWNAACGIRCSQ